MRISLKQNLYRYLCALAGAGGLMLAPSAPLYAASYFVMEAPQSVSAGAAGSVSVQSLLSASVTNAGGALSATAERADYVLKSELVQLGQAYILTVTRLKAGEPLNSTRQKASSVEELDEAADRAVRAAIRGAGAAKDVRVGEVQERDEHRLSRRMQSRHSTYFGLGPASFSNLGTAPLAYDVALGFNWEVNPYAMIRVLGDFTAGNSFRTYFTSAQLGLNYFFTDSDQAPYVSGLLGFGSAGTLLSRARPIGGLAGSVGAGYMFFRTSSTQLDVFVGYNTVFGNNSYGAPGSYGLRIGVYF